MSNYIEEEKPSSPLMSNFFNEKAGEDLDMLS